MAEEVDEFAQKYPLVYKHTRNYAAKIIQKSWNKYMARVTYKYLLKCCKDFENTLTPKDLSRIYPEFLESSDSKMSAKLQIKMQGTSFPPCLVCRIINEQAPSVDGKKHNPKWIPLFNSGHSPNPIDQKGLVRLYLEAQHLQNEQKELDQKSGKMSRQSMDTRNSSIRNNTRVQTANTQSTPTVSGRPSSLKK